MSEDAFHLDTLTRLKAIRVRLLAAVLGRFDPTATEIKRHSIPSITRRIELYESELAEANPEPPDVIEKAMRELELWTRRVERGSEAGEWLTIPDKSQVFAADKLVNPANIFQGVTLKGAAV